MFPLIETLLNILRCSNCYIAVSIYIVFVLYLFDNFPFCFFSCFSFFDFCFLSLLLGAIFKPYKNTLLTFAGWSFFCEGLIRRYFCCVVTQRLLFFVKICGYISWVCSTDNFLSPIFSQYL